MDFDRLIDKFDRTISKWGVVGSIITGSSISYNDQGDETVTWSSSAGSFYIRQLSSREREFLREGERVDGRLIGYFGNSIDFAPGSVYRVGYNSEEYELESFKRHSPAGSLVFTSANLIRIDND